MGSWGTQMCTFWRPFVEPPNQFCLPVHYFWSRSCSKPFSGVVILGPQGSDLGSRGSDPRSRGPGSGLEGPKGGLRGLEGLGLPGLKGIPNGIQYPFSWALNR